MAMENKNILWRNQLHASQCQACMELYPTMASLTQEDGGVPTHKFSPTSAAHWQLELMQSVGPLQVLNMFDA
jgi:hypothetical protein